MLLRNFIKEAEDKEVQPADAPQSDDTPTDEEGSGGFEITIGKTYVFTPVIIKDVNDELHSLLTVYSPHDDEIKPYSIQGTDPVVFTVIRSEETFEDSRIVRVQIVSDVDHQVEKYDAENEELIYDENNEPVVLKLKQLPDFDNLDLISDETFEELYGHRRKPYEHGLVGYLYLDQPPSDAKDFNTTKVGDNMNLSIGYDAEQEHMGTGRHAGKPHHKGAGEKRHHAAVVKAYNRRTDKEHHHMSKMQQAIALYKSNRALPRLRVIKMLMTYLDMTRAGASSYYTKAMHAVEAEEGQE